MADRRTVHRVCTLCEATCGITVEAEGDRVLSIRGDKDDPFSRGFICPKAYALKGLQEDPDRLRRPVRRTADGWEEISWDEAYAEAGAGLLAVRERYGNNAIGMYIGNPVVHELGALLYLQVFRRALASKNVFNASAVDTLPKQVSTGLLFGWGWPSGVPVPDVDRTEYMLILGANPAVSHGSLFTAPNIPGRLKALRKRGGKVVVIDPRRTETAELADEHHFIRPGGDAALLFAVLQTMFAEDLISLGAAHQLVNGLDEVEELVRDFTPDAVADYCGIPAGSIRRLTREFCAAKAAICYGRLGTCVQEFGTLASWAVDAINILSGNLDKPGGAMFPLPAAPVGFAARDAGRTPFGRWRSRVGGLPEAFREIPSSAMADEMLTPGDGQVRAMVLIATNPVCSASNSQRLDQAFASLDCLVCVDWYINETTRHAHVILPPVGPLEIDNYDLGLYTMAVRTIAKVSRAAIDPDPDTQETWEILLRLSAHLMSMGDAPTQMVDDFVFRQVAEAATATEKRWEGLSAEECIERCGDTPGPWRVLDLLLRLGEFGDGFGRNPDGITLDKVRGAQHGLDLGPMRPRLRDVLNTASGKIELAPQLVLDDVPRLRAALARPVDGFLLIGRRHLHSVNSHIHNVPAMVKGPDRCTLLVSEPDALRLQLETGGRARVTSRVGSVVAPVEVSDEVMPGVVSLPHGWGHDMDGMRMAVATAHAGVNANILADDAQRDVPTGTSVLNGIPVTVEPLS